MNPNLKDIHLNGITIIRSKRDNDFTDGVLKMGYLFYFMSWETQYEVHAISEDHMQVFTWTPNDDGGTSLRALYLIKEGTPSGNDPIEWDWSSDN